MMERMNIVYSIYNTLITMFIKDNSELYLVIVSYILASIVNIHLILRICMNILNELKNTA